MAWGTRCQCLAIPPRAHMPYLKAYQISILVYIPELNYSAIAKDIGLGSALKVVTADS